MCTNYFAESFNRNNGPVIQHQITAHERSVTVIMLFEVSIFHASILARLVLRCGDGFCSMGSWMFSRSFSGRKVCFEPPQFHSCGSLCYHTAPTEHCEVDNKSYHILGNQQAGNTINYVGTLVEDTNSILLIAVIFSWKVFRLKHFIRALPRVGYFGFGVCFARRVLSPFSTWIFCMEKTTMET